MSQIQSCLALSFQVGMPLMMAVQQREDYQVMSWQEYKLNLTHMHFIDLYGGLRATREDEGKEQTVPDQLDSQSSHLPPFLLALRKKILKNYPNDYVSIIDCQKLHHRHRFGNEYMLEYLQQGVHFKQYQFYFEVAFNPTLYLLHIRGTFIKNGLFMHLQSKDRILMAIRLLNNVNRDLNPLKLNVNQLSGEICLEHSSFIDSTLADFRYQRNLINLVSRIYFIIELMIRNRFLLIFYLDESTQLLAAKATPTGEIQRLMRDRDKLDKIASNLSEMCLQTYDSKYKVEASTRRQAYNSQIQYFTSDFQRSVATLTSQMARKTTSVKRVANEEYSQAEMRALLAKKEEKYGFKINVGVEFTQIPEWKREEVGGYGIICSSNAKFRITDKELLSTSRDIQQTNRIYEQKMAMKIERHQERGQLCSRISIQKQIISSIGHLSHPNILTFFEESSKDIDCLYSLWQDNSSLKNYIEKIQCLSLYQMLLMMQQSAKGLYFLHKHGIVHFDFKPANIIVSRMLLVKLTDFGESHLMSQSLKRNQFGYTFPYAPPEISTLGGKYPVNLKITPQIDVYSLGVTIYQCFFGDYVWGSLFKSHRKGKVLHNVQPWIVPEKFRDAGERRVAIMLAYVSLRCIAPNPSNRPKLPWIITILEQCRKCLSELHYQ